MADFSSTYSIIGVDTLSGPAGAAERSLAGLEGAAGRVGGAMVGLAETAAKAALAVGAITATAFIGGMTAAVTSAASFEKEMSAVGAVSGATAEQLKQLSTLALKLGADTSFSASQSATGIEELVKAGVSIADVMGGAAKASLDLAAAGGLSVAESATIASNAMNVFSLKGADMAHVADEIAGAANASAIDVHEFGFSLSAVGAVAATVGLSLDDTTTAIAVLGQAGLKGSDAGTSLKTMLLNLGGQSKAATDEMKTLGIITADGANQFFDATGKVKSMADVAGVLQTATAGLTQEQKLQALQTMFGTDAIRAAAIMAKAGAAGFNDMATSIGKISAADVANARLDNLAGSIEKFKGSLETAGITMGQHFLPPLKRLVDLATGGLNAALPMFDKFGTAAAVAFDSLITKITAAGPAMVGLGRYLLATAMYGDSLNDWLTHVPAAAQPAVKAFGDITAAIRGGLIAAIPAAVNAVGRLLGLSIEDYGSKWDLLGGIVTRSMELASTAIGGLVGAVKAGLPAIQNAFSTLLPIVESVGQSFIDNLATNIRFITERVIPPLVSIVQQTAPLFTGTLLPAFQQTGTVLRGILGDSLTWLAAEVWPNFLNIAKQSTDWFTGTLLPVLPTVAGELRQALGETVLWLATTAWPALTAAATTAVNLFTTYVVPAIVPVTAALRDGLGTAIEWISTTGWPMFTAAATIASTFVTGTLLPAVTALATWLKTNVPPALEAVVTAFTDLKTRLTPIVQAVFAGDIKAALAGLGSAFVDFATLAGGWLKEQAAKINWTAVWATAKDVLVSTADWFVDAATLFAGWIGDQVAAISWSDVWNKAVDVFESAAMWFGDAAGKLATWIGDQAAAIDWTNVWNRAVAVFDSAVMWFGDAATKLATWIGDQVAAIDWTSVWNKAVAVFDTAAMWFGDAAGKLGTWIGAQAALIPWETVWANVTTAGSTLGTYLLTQAVDMTTWLGQQAALIQWDVVWSNITGMSVALNAAMVKDVQKTPLDWPTIFGGIDATSASWAQFLDDSATNIDWDARGKVWGAEFVKALQGMFEGGFTKATEDTGAWAGWGDKVSVATLQAIGDSLTRSVADMTKIILDWLGGAWKEAIGQWNPVWPSWVPGVGGKPINGNPQPDPGASGTGAPATGGSSAPAGGGSNMSMPSTYTSEWEQKAYAAAIKAGHTDPTQFVEQMRQEAHGENLTSAAGARGPAQIMPAEAAAAGIDPTNIDQAYEYAANRMAAARAKYGDPNVALASYNAGEGAVSKYGGVPPYSETQAYVSTINQRTAAAGPKPAPGAAGMVTYKDQWGNVHTVTQAQFDARPGGNSDVTVIPPEGQPASQRQNTSGAVNMAGQVNAGQPFQGQNAPIGNQFELGLPRDQAEAACGPAAVALFVAATGRTPNAEEVMRISARNGWRVEKGMGGVGAFMGALGEEGVNAALLAPTGQAAAGSVQQGNLTAISTGGGNVPLNSGHYFVAQGFDPQTQQFDLGETGGPDPNNPNAAHALRGGSRFMTAEQITALAGPINGVIQLLNQATGASDATVTSLKGLGDQAPVTGTQFDTMTQDSVTGVTALGDSITTFSTDGLGTLIKTTTDTTGQVTGLFAEMSTGVQLNMADTAAGVTTTQQEMNGNLVTTTADTVGNMVSTVTDGNGQIVAQFSTTAGQVETINADMGTQVVADTNGAVTEQNSIFTTGGATQVATAQATATGVIAADADMATGATAQAVLMSTSVLQSVTDMGNGITQTVTTTADGTVATLTDWSGQVVGIYTDTSSQTSDAISEMASSTEDSMNQAADSAKPVVTAFGEVSKSAASIKPVNMGDTVKNLQAVEKAAKSATKSLQELAAANTGGGKSIKADPGSSGGQKSKSAGGEAAGAPSVAATGVADMVSVASNVMARAITDAIPQGIVTGTPAQANEAPVNETGTSTGTAPRSAPAPAHPRESPPGFAPTPATPAPTPPFVRPPAPVLAPTFAPTLTTAFDGLTDAGSLMSVTLNKNFNTMVKKMIADGILLDRGLGDDADVMRTDVTAASEVMRIGVTASAELMRLGTERSLDGMQQSVDDTVGATVDLVTDMQTAVADITNTMATDSIKNAGRMRDDVNKSADEMRDHVVGAVSVFADKVSNGILDARDPSRIAADTVKGVVLTSFGALRDGALDVVDDLASPTGIPGSLDEASDPSVAAAVKLGQEVDAGIVKGINKDQGDIAEAIKKAINKAVQSASRSVASSVSLGPAVSQIDLMPQQQTQLSMDFDYARLAKEFAKVQRDQNLNLTINTNAPYEPIAQDFAVLQAMARRES